MMTRDYAAPDWRGLCEELLRELENCIAVHYGEGGTHHISAADAVIAKADAALARLAFAAGAAAGADHVPGATKMVGSAPAEGEGVKPTRDDLWELWLRLNNELPDRPAAVAEFWEHAQIDARARWGRPAPVPAEGEVAELVRQLGVMAADAEAADFVSDAAKLTRAAELLEQRQAAPVPVADRLPGPEDCDAEGRCWLFSKVEKEWRLIDAGNPGVPHLKYCFSHWLPATALPLPQGEVQP